MLRPVIFIVVGIFLEGYMATGTERLNAEEVYDGYGIPPGGLTLDTTSQALVRIPARHRRIHIVHIVLFATGTEVKVWNSGTPVPLAYRFHVVLSAFATDCLLRIYELVHLTSKAS